MVEPKTNYFFAPLTDRTTRRAAPLMPLAKLLLAVDFGLAGVLALTEVLIGAFRAAGFRRETPEPLEAAARIFFLVSADGRFNPAAFLAGEAGAALVAFVVFVCLEARTAALIRPVDLTAGSLTLAFAVTVFFVVLLPRIVATAFFTPALIELDLVVLRCLAWMCPSSSESSESSEAFRFLPMSFFVAAFLGLPSALRFSSSSLARCCLSFRRGPKKPRQLADPQRHCCTFLLEYGLTKD